MMRNDLKCPQTGFDSPVRFAVLVGLFSLMIVVTFSPPAAHAEGSGELGDSIRNLTLPVMESVRSAIRTNQSVTRDKAETDPDKETQTSDSSKKVDSPDSDGIEPPSVQ